MTRFATLLPLIAIGCVIGCGSDTKSTSGAKGDPSVIVKNGTDPKGNDQADEKKETSRSNLRALATGLIDGINPGGGLSAGVYATDGKTVGLSWRVAILPALKQEALYKQFKLDEPWDGPNNKKLIARMPAIFASPGKTAGEGMTFYRAFTGGNAMLTPRGTGAAGKNALGAKWPDDIQDGTGNTALIAEAAEAVVWTKPDEIDASKSMPNLGGIFADGAHIAFADCDATFFKTGDLNEKKVKAMITPAGNDLADYPGPPKPISGTSGATRR